MALATTCPQCKTSFKVVPDQLKLRRGLVRCGVCQHVFSGIDFLRYVDDAGNAVRSDNGPGAVDQPPVGTPAPAADHLDRHRQDEARQDEARPDAAGPILARDSAALSREERSRARRAARRNRGIRPDAETTPGVSA